MDVSYPGPGLRNAMEMRSVFQHTKRRSREVFGLSDGRVHMLLRGMSMTSRLFDINARRCAELPRPPRPPCRQGPIDKQGNETNSIRALFAPGTFNGRDAVLSNMLGEESRCV